MESVNVVMAVLFLLVIVFILAQVIMKPIKILWKVLFNSAVGLVLLILFNYLAAFFTFTLPINVVTVLITGFLGIPGILLLICFQIMFV